jgi:hypothetical protein
MPRTSKRARRTSAYYLPSAFDLFTSSKNLVLKHIWIFGPLYAIPFIFWIHSWIWAPLPNQHVSWWHSIDGFSSGWPGSPIPTYSTFLVVGFSALWFLFIAAAGTITQIMSNAAQLYAAEGKEFDFHTLWQVVRQLGWRLLGLYIVMFLLIALGFVLLIVPGLMLLRRFFMAPYIMVDKRLGIRESLEQSIDLTNRNPGSVWGIVGVMFLIGLINILPIIGGLASFIFGFLYSVAPAIRYRQLKKLA